MSNHMQYAVLFNNSLSPCAIPDWTVSLISTDECILQLLLLQTQVFLSACETTVPSIFRNNWTFPISA